MNETFATPANFFRRNQTRILVTALVVTTTVAVLQNGGIKRLNEFLKENDLFDTYYFPENDD